MGFPFYQDRLEPALKQVADPLVKRSNDWNRLSERFERSKTIERLERFEQ
jgi:hypothetical protein